MKIETRREGVILVLKPLSENINATNCTEFKAGVVDQIKQGNYFILLDLSQVDFIDSSGLGSIISILKILEVNNGIIVLSEVKKPIINLFRLTRMDRVFKLVPTEKEGIAMILNQKNSPSCMQKI